MNLKDEIYTPEALAEILGVSEKTLFSVPIPYTILHSKARKRIYLRADVLEFLQGNRISADGFNPHHRG